MRPSRTKHVRGNTTPLEREGAMQRSMVFAAMVLTAACGGGVTEPPPGIYEVSGTVSEEAQAGRRPSSGASVVFERAGEIQRVSSDLNGNFAISGLAAGRWNVTVRKAGYEPQSKEIEVAGNMRLPPFQLEYDSERRRDRHPRDRREH